jgi:hypothetical protein
MFDELAQQYFSSPEEFAAALKLLQRCSDAGKRYPKYSYFEANFLDNLDDVTDSETALLNTALDYHAAKKNAVGGTPMLSLLRVK